MLALTFILCIYQTLETDAMHMRSTNLPNHRRISEPMSSLLSLPSTFKDGKNKCNGHTCRDKSTCFEFNPPLCRCDQGYVFSIKQKICTNRRVLIVKGFKVLDKWSEAYRNVDSKEFVKFALRKEPLIKKLIDVHKMSTDGVKIIKAKKIDDEVILDVAFLIGNTHTLREAREKITKTFQYEEIKNSILSKELGKSLNNDFKEYPKRKEIMVTPTSSSSNSHNAKDKEDYDQEEWLSNTNSILSVSNANKTQELVENSVENKINITALIPTILGPVILLLMIVILLIKISGLKKFKTNYPIRVVGKHDRRFFVVTNPDYDGEFTIVHKKCGRTKLDRSISEDSGLDILEGVEYKF